MKPRPALRYHGGKWRLAPWIIQHFPEHRVYTEPFCGAASVLLQKPRSYAEVINDLADDVVNYFHVLQDEKQAAELQRLIYLTPFARAEFELSYQDCIDPVERARRLLVRSFMGFGSAAHNINHRTGFRANSNRSGTTPAHDWANYPEQLHRLTERLRGVCIENRQAVDVLRQHDAPEALHYVDPPYPHSTRGKRQSGNYSFELTDDQHRELSDCLRSMKGAVLLSGYPCDLYDGELYADWERVERTSFADGARARVEVLWLNPVAVERLAAGKAQRTLEALQ